MRRLVSDQPSIRGKVILISDRLMSITTFKLPFKGMGNLLVRVNLMMPTVVILNSCWRCFILRERDFQTFSFLGNAVDESFFLGEFIDKRVPCRNFDKVKIYRGNRHAAIPTSCQLPIRTLMRLIWTIHREIAKIFKASTESQNCTMCGPEIITILRVASYCYIFYRRMYGKSKPPFIPFNLERLRRACQIS